MRVCVSVLCVCVWQHLSSAAAAARKKQQAVVVVVPLATAGAAAYWDLFLGAQTKNSNSQSKPVHHQQQHSNNKNITNNNKKVAQVKIPALYEFVCVLLFFFIIFLTIFAKSENQFAERARAWPKESETRRERENNQRESELCQVLLCRKYNPTQAK